MQIGVMITNGGVHSAGDWALLSASEIIDLKDGAASATIAGRRLALAVLTALEIIYGRAQEDEREKLAREGEARLSLAIDPRQYLARAIDEIVATADDTVFDAHFARPEVRQHISNVLRHHLSLLLDIERSQFADGRPDSDLVQVYRMARAEHGFEKLHFHLADFKAAPAQPAN